MKVVADENIPYVREAFAGFGDVVLMPGRAMGPADVREAQILLVRSVTHVDRGLLGENAVQFVATATIGMDHVDREFLDERNIGFASAPGSNANSVSEWFVAALLCWAEAEHVELAGKTLGIVGVGNVGKRVLAKAKSLGMEVLCNDPPRARAEGAGAFVQREALLAESDVVTVHVPLIRDGQDRTVDLADAGFFAAMRPGALFVNSSRGAVVQEPALLEALARGHLNGAVLDVWQNEPEIATALLDRVFLGTPHVAGYSFDGKVAGTRMIYEAACRHFGKTPQWDPMPLLPAAEIPEAEFVIGPGTLQQALHGLVSRVYDIRADHTRLRGLHDLPIHEQGAYFTHLRKAYPRRREFPCTAVRMGAPDPGAASMLEGLGFRVVPGA